jgi:uncharacterized membrane protein required for colicin V production
MLYLDLVIILILLLFFLNGFRRGLIQVVGGLAGIILGALLALKYTDGYEGITKFLIFALIFIIANRLTAFAFHFLGRLFNLVAIIPGLKSINRIAGGMAGIIEGTLVIGIILFVLEQIPLFEAWKQILQEARLVKPLSTLGGTLLPLLQGLLK